MRLNITMLPVLVGALLLAFVAMFDSAPDHFADANKMVGSSLATGSGKAQGEVPAVWTYTVPRVAVQLEGDLSPVGDGSTARVFDFPAFAFKPTPTTAPTPVPTVRADARPGAALSTNIAAALEQCRQNPDRYNWKAYALAAGFPAHVVDGEMEYVIGHESGGDLCARNPSSGAICWVQQISGEAKYLDPATCMGIGFAKWVDGGRDFYKHWYRWWVR